jgi:uncharacterized protein YndB with AHSA1/START domain
MGKSELIIERIFNASIDLVWKAWTDSRYQTKWWGPKDFTAPFCRNDFRESGKYLNCMRSKEGQDYWNTGTYKEISNFKRIVCTDSFSDDKGNVISASVYGLGEDFPLEMEVIIEFEKVDNKTRMILRHIGLPEGDMKDMIMTGWNESFDKLDNLLAGQSE